MGLVLLKLTHVEMVFRNLLLVRTLLFVCGAGVYMCMHVFESVYDV